MSEGDITITADEFNTPSDRRMIFASRNGDITINLNPGTPEIGSFVKTNINPILKNFLKEFVFTI